ncbi:MAG: stage II sporulation protein P [Oscillospiraceae bacterium]|nr:stage II sporulation protein P [Oscillospiraceae bacterium]
MGRVVRYIRRGAAVTAAVAILWAAVSWGGGELSFREVGRSLVLHQLRTQFPAPHSPVTSLILRQSPQLAAAVKIDVQPSEQTGESLNSPLPHGVPSLSPIPQADPEKLQFLDNGVPSQTVKITNPKGYTTVGSVYIKNSSGKTVDAAALSPPRRPAASANGPQVLILHTHGSEAYTLPKGQSYPSTGNYRTSDTSCSVVRIGDEIAAALSSYGISVLHDRTLYDDPLYSDAYSRSAAGAEMYLEKYPSLYYILDIHRDAVEDAQHNQYKLVAQEDNTVAQMSFVIGTNYDHWQENLSLAVAVSQQVQQDYPTAMRPIILRSSRYNQHLSPGALLLEVGAAGNSLDEARHAGRIFAAALAEVILNT